MLKLTPNDYIIIGKMIKDDDNVETDHVLSKGYCYLQWSGLSEDVIIHQGKKVYTITITEDEQSVGKDPAPYLAKIRQYEVRRQMEKAIKWK